MIQLENKLYTSTEVAEILGVSLRSVYRYIEENKLEAEVKTATGRHRFTRQNIVDFLYPNGEPDEKQDQSDSFKTKKMREPVAPTRVQVPEEVAPDVEEQPTAAEDITPKKAAKVIPQEEPVEEEPVDWLAKFREAAKKFEEERKETKEVKEETVAPARADVEEVFSVKSDTVRVSEEPAFSSMVDTKYTAPKTQQVYFRSKLGGLKDIAQNLDKGARNAGLDYAFTLNAGLSLFKPIKPFSLLHAYVRVGDREFFEKTLSLLPSDETSAQICLILSDDESIFESKSELHGLNVVSKTQLLDDIQSMGDASLQQEAEGVLK